MRESAGRPRPFRHVPVLVWVLVAGAVLAAGHGRAAAHGIDTDAVWRSDAGVVFSQEQLAKIERVLKNARCRNEKTGCGYRSDGRPVKGSAADIQLIPWKVSAHPGFLVRADLCGAGGCDEGLFVRIAGKWRLLIESFGMLERDRTSTRGFRDLVFRPRGASPIRLVWNGKAYQPID